MRKEYETPTMEIVSLESKELVCADSFYGLFGLSSSADGVNTVQHVFDWSAE